MHGTHPRFYNPGGSRSTKMFGQRLRSFRWSHTFAVQQIKADKELCDTFEYGHDILSRRLRLILKIKSSYIRRANGEAEIVDCYHDVVAPYGPSFDLAPLSIASLIS